TNSNRVAGLPIALDLDLCRSGNVKRHLKRDLTIRRIEQRHGSAVYSDRGPSQSSNQWRSLPRRVGAERKLLALHDHHVAGGYRITGNECPVIEDALVINQRRILSDHL